MVHTTEAADGAAKTHGLLASIEVRSTLSLAHPSIVWLHNRPNWRKEALLLHSCTRHAVGEQRATSHLPSCPRASKYSIVRELRDYKPFHMCLSDTYFHVKELCPDPLCTVTGAVSIYLGHTSNGIGNLLGSYIIHAYIFICCIYRYT